MWPATSVVRTRAGNSKRQRSYVTALGARYVYTPQIVVGVFVGFDD